MARPKANANVEVDEDELQAGEVIYRGSAADGDWPSDITVNYTDHMGFAVVYDRVTREPSRVLKSMLSGILQAKDDAGNLIYTSRRPARPPERGALLCYLHPDHPDQQRYNQLGIHTTCRKANLVSGSEREHHMQVRHPSAWKTIQDETRKAEQERIRKEDRDFQERMATMQLETLKAVMGQKGATSG